VWSCPPQTPTFVSSFDADLPMSPGACDGSRPRSPIRPARRATSSTDSGEPEQPASRTVSAHGSAVGAKPFRANHPLTNLPGRRRTDRHRSGRPICETPATVGCNHIGEDGSSPDDTTEPELRIRRLGVRVPPSAPIETPGKPGVSCISNSPRSVASTAMLTDGSHCSAGRGPGSQQLPAPPCRPPAAREHPHAGSDRTTATDPRLRWFGLPMVVPR